VKFFPASALGGTGFLRAVSATYRDVGFIPTGGVSPANLREYLDLPCVVACGGSWIVDADDASKNRVRSYARRRLRSRSLVIPGHPEPGTPPPQNPNHDRVPPGASASRRAEEAPQHLGRCLVGGDDDDDGWLRRHHTEDQLRSRGRDRGHARRYRVHRAADRSIGPRFLAGEVREEVDELEAVEEDVLGELREVTARLQRLEARVAQLRRG
jgi:hypothetical protein